MEFVSSGSSRVGYPRRGFSVFSHIFLQAYNPVQNQIVLRRLSINAEVGHAHSLESNRFRPRGCLLDSTFWAAFSCVYKLLFTRFSGPRCPLSDFFESTFNHGMREDLFRVGVDVCQKAIRMRCRVI